MAKFYAQIWQFWKSAHISETTARRAKISSILMPWKGSICGTLANGQVGSEAERQGPWASCYYMRSPEGFFFQFGFTGKLNLISVNWYRILFELHLGEVINIQLGARSTAKILLRLPISMFSVNKDALYGCMWSNKICIYQFYHMNDMNFIPLIFLGLTYLYFITA